MHDHDAESERHEKNMEAENDPAISGIRESLDFLDSRIEVKKPDFMKFVELVNEVQERKKTRRNWQFAAFLPTALLVAAVETYFFYRSMAFFVALQAAALMCIVPALIIWNKRKSRQVSD